MTRSVPRAGRRCPVCEFVHYPASRTAPSTCRICGAALDDARR
ncbi:hypothetical protein [Salinilacihabitans rarus]|nr:hypothetical protein [Salinilacihabitans rarus]